MMDKLFVKKKNNMDKLFEHQNSATGNSKK